MSKVKEKFYELSLTIRILLIILLIALIPITIRIYDTYFKDKSISTKIFNNQLEKTSVAPHMEHKIIDNVNIVYCSTFQLCWNEMKDLLNGDIELEDNPEIVECLNKSLSTKDDISEDSYVAVAGFKKDIIDVINKQLEDKFDNPPRVSFSEASPSDLIAYSYLYKNLKFPKEFESLEEPLYFIDNNKKIGVKAFGIKEYSDKNKELGNQVDIVDYIDQDDFIIRLKTKTVNEEIILAKVKPGETLLDTIETVNNRTKSGFDGVLTNDDVLIIPKFSFDIEHSFNELKNKHLLNDGFKEYHVKEAAQQVKFVLDETGVVLESEAVLSFTKSAKVSRYFVFDQPFLLYMKEKGANYPYFAMWVENTELMTNYN